MPKTLQASSQVAERPAGRELYEHDEHEWIAAQIATLADGALDRLDRANRAEYLTKMTVRDRRELQSRLLVLLHHLLKVQIQPERLTRSWVMPTLEQQSEVRSIINSIPSLGRQAETLIAAPYADAVQRAVRETGLSTTRFTAALPWTVAEAIAFDPPEPLARSEHHQ